MNINYINESIISVAVMRRIHTRTHLCTHTRTHKHMHMPSQRGEDTEEEDVCYVSTNLSLAKSITVKLANDL